MTGSSGFWRIVGSKTLDEAMDRVRAEVRPIASRASPEVLRLESGFAKSGQTAPNANRTQTSWAARAGKRNYLAGLCAEESVAQAYHRSGREVVARRWRGSRGEIDVIVREGSKLVFVEVKKSRTHDMAGWHINQRQMERIWFTGTEFLEGEPAGQRTEFRFDVALVDEMGRIEIRENAYAA